MCFLLKNQKGFAGAMLVIAVAAIVGIMIIGISHKMGDLTKAYDKSRAFNDAELAIEKFSVTLKNAYDRANYLTDLRPDTAGTAALEDFGCPGKVIKIGTDPLNTIKLCWEFGGTGGSLCTKRSREAGGPADICLDQGNLQVSFKASNDWEVAVRTPKMSSEEKWTLFKEISIGLIKDFGVAPAHANLDAFRPGLPAGTYANSIVINNNVNTLSRPEAPDCTPGPDYQCLKIAFCVKSAGGCASDEMIRQTYIFSKPATTTQAW